MKNKIKVHDEFVSGVLNNGIKYMLYPRNESSSTIVGVTVKSGAYNENVEVSGISHAIEHMLFKSTEKTSTKKLTDGFSRLGAVTNAFTDFDNTTFYAHGPYQNVGKIIKMLGEMITLPAFKDKEWAVEKKAILEEIKMRYDDHSTFAIESATTGLFNGNSRQGLPIIGSEECVQRMTADDLRTYYLSHFNVYTICLVVVGRMDVQKVISYLQEAFGSGINYDGYLKKFDLTYDAASSNETIEREINQSHFCRTNLVYHIPYGSQRYYKFSLLNKIYGSGSSSRLFQEIREKRGLAYQVCSFFEPFRNDIIFYTYAGVKSDKITDVTKMINDVQRRIIDAKIPTAEINRAKADLIGGNMRRHDDMHGVFVDACTALRYNGAPHDINCIVERIDSVCEEDVKSAATEIFENSPQFTFRLLPKGGAK